MEIRKLHPVEVDKALALAESVFIQENAQSFPEHAVDFFLNQLIRNDNFRDEYKEGICKIYGAVGSDGVHGVLTVNRGDNKLNLLFVERRYQRSGIATRMFAQFLRENPEVHEIYANSIPGTVAFFEKIGFHQMLPPISGSGITFTTMRYQRKR